MGQLQNWPVGHRTQLVPVIQGNFLVSSDPAVAFSTVLGSCASVCLFDKFAKIGGMNHYLLANGANEGTANLKYGGHAMELLINQLLKQGASRHRLKAKVFGGSRMMGRFNYIGPSNTSFTLQYLSDEGFMVVSKDLGGKHARRVNFHPVTGNARVVSSAPMDETLELSKVLRKKDRELKSNLTLF